MKVSETFISLQGEGPYVGLPSLFIRVAGCNLSSLPCGPCTMCDTKYALGPGKEIKLSELVELLLKSNYPLVVITGGEPLQYQKELLGVLNSLPKDCLPRLNIETNGTIPPFDQWKDFSVLFSVSPKVHTKDFLHLSDFSEFTAVLKVIYDKSLSDSDFYQFISDCSSKMRLTTRDDIYVMPESVNLQSFLDHSQDCVEFCLKYSLRFGPREHIILFNGVRAK